MAVAEPEKAVGTFLQRPSFSAFERLICSHLIEASRDDPLQTVIHVCRAALAVAEDAAEQLGIDRNEALSLYTVAQRLATATKSEKGGMEYYSVLFHTLEWKKDIEPWKKPPYYSFYPFNPALKEESAQFKDEKQEFFNVTAKALSPRGYAHMISDFLVYAIPIVEAMTRKLAALISPETYGEMLRLYHGEKV